ncbi:MAG: hypothetical protein ACRCVT_05045, partial [Leadbetterella sp.]
MKSLFSVFLYIFLTNTLVAQDYTCIVGRYTDTSESGLSLLTFDNTKMNLEVLFKYDSIPNPTY